MIVSNDGESTEQELEQCTGNRAYIGFHRRYNGYCGPKFLVCLWYRVQMILAFLLASTSLEAPKL